MSEDLAPAEDTIHREAYTRAMGLGVTAAVMTLPLALYARSSSPDPATVPVLAADARLYYLLAVALSALIGLFAQYTDRDPAWARNGAVRLGYRWIADQARATTWILPVMTVATVCLLVAIYHRWPVVLVAPILAGSGVFVGALARHYAFDANVEARRSARLAMLAALHLMSFVLLSLIYILRMRSALSAPVVAISVVLVILATTDALDAPLRQRVILAIAAGVVMAEATWALNSWNAPGWYGGVVLWVLTFSVASAIGARIESRLNATLVMRLSGFALIVVAVVAFVADQPL